MSGLARVGCAFAALLCLISAAASPIAQNRLGRRAARCSHEDIADPFDDTYECTWAPGAHRPRACDVRQPCDFSHLNLRSPFKFYAFYFPQFYPVLENEYKTDWDYFDASVRAIPHIYLPRNDNFYDARDFDQRQAQNYYANKYGLDGFIYYHYYFDDAAVLEDPIRLRQLDGEPNLDFAFLWVNEDFLLRKVTYTNPRRHAIYLAEQMAHPAYIYREGRPLLYVYHLRRVPKEYRTTLLAAVERILGVRPFLVQMLQLDGGDMAQQPYADGFAEFSVNLGRTRRAGPPIDHGVPVERGTWLNFNRQPRALHGVNAHSEPRPKVMRTPEQVYQHCVDRFSARPYNETVLHIFAWNEWSEQSMMEPNHRDADFGMAIRRCKEALTFGVA